MNSKSPVLFDDALPLFVRALSRAIGDSAVQGGVVIRDGTGRLSFVCGRNAQSDDERQRVTRAVKQMLGPYARSERPIAFLEDSGAAPLLKDPSRVPIQVGDLICQLLDRRIVGAGWLDTPTDRPARPTRVVFASLKGGVGRSTALAVTAADLARRNKNLLIIDLDLEAPGLGELLLDGARVPRLGVVDFLVENGIGGVPAAMLGDFVGSSALTTGGGGRVDVVPALGRQALSTPENVLPKLARAMIEDVSEDGESQTVSEQISTMISQLSARAPYDIILVDSRAGLAELAAPAILGLGGLVLLFGTAQPYTTSGYRALFAGLRLLANRDRAHGRAANWRLNLKAVHAKASLDSQALARYRDDLYELFAEELYDEDRGLEAVDDVNFDIDERDAPHSPLIIPFNQAFGDFNPVRRPNELTQPFYEQTFRPFLDGLDALINTEADSTSDSVE